MHRYLPSADYINDLTFEYIETYSLQRGREYEESLKNIRIEYDKLKQQKLTQKTLSSDDEQRYNKLNQLLGFTQYLINADSEFHPSSKKMNTFTSKDPKVTLLKQILKTEVVSVPKLLCAPEYRDAIVFYNSEGSVVSVLNVCLSCLYMETEMFNYINADYQAYDLLKRFFIEIGHEVENPNYFVMDEINKLEARNNKS